MIEHGFAAPYDNHAAFVRSVPHDTRNGGQDDKQTNANDGGNNCELWPRVQFGA